jgi:hypothetical protein
MIILVFVYFAAKKEAATLRAREEVAAAQGCGCDTYYLGCGLLRVALNHVMISLASGSSVYLRLY